MIPLEMISWVGTIATGLAALFGAVITWLAARRGDAVSKVSFLALVKKEFALKKERRKSSGRSDREEDGASSDSRKSVGDE